MSEHIWRKVNKGVTECSKCGVLSGCPFTNCDEIAQINATHKWYVKNKQWYCSKCGCFGFDEFYVPICNKSGIIKTCQEEMMERVLK